MKTSNNLFTSSAKQALLKAFNKISDTMVRKLVVISWNRNHAQVVSFPFPGDLPDPETEPGSPTLQEDSSPSEQPEKPIIW